MEALKTHALQPLDPDFHKKGFWIPACAGMTKKASLDYILHHAARSLSDLRSDKLL